MNNTKGRRLHTIAAYALRKDRLTDEQYERATAAEKKPKRERTVEEQAAIDQMNALKKQRRTMISILRGISIRIPLMLYGLDVPVGDSVSVTQFADAVDDASWAEFMPAGVTKALFRKFTKYYDADVFIEAGRIIRRKVKALDDLPPIERAEALTPILATFCNPDKETVLTPWRVVNLQLGKTIGGLSFYDDTYEHQTVAGRPARHWIKTAVTDQVYRNDARILEINAKTGLYPLYVALSCFDEGQRRLAGSLPAAEQGRLWQQVLAKNIYVVAKTPMAAAIARRTLAGYHHWDTNIVYINGLVAAARADVRDAAAKIEREFGKMKFDVVIGNPPYQQNANGESTRSEPIYHLFMDLAYQLAPVVSLITPARFLFNAGQTPKAWNRKMLDDPHLKVVMYEQDSSKIFPNTDIKGGVAITYRDVNQDFGEIGVFTTYEALRSIVKKVSKKEHAQESMDKYVSSRGNFRFTKKFFIDHPDAKDRLGKGTGNMIVSNVFEKLDKIFLIEKPKNTMGGYLRFLGRINNERAYRYIRTDYVQSNSYLDVYKIFIPKANGRGILGEKLSMPIIGKPNEGATDTFVSIGCFQSFEEAEALLKYIKTKFLRVLLGIKKVTQDNSQSVWDLVPIQNFTDHLDIDWSQPIPAIDRQLYAKYGLTEEEIAFIETKVQAMI